MNWDFLLNDLRKLKGLLDNNDLDEVNDLLDSMILEVDILSRESKTMVLRK
jgi:pantothenate kinase